METEEIIQEETGSQPDEVMVETVENPGEDVRSPDDSGVEQPAGEETAVDIDALVAEAEQRGYLRGRNERISEELDAPALYGIPGGDDADKSQEEDPNNPCGFLSYIRPSVWD